MKIFYLLIIFLLTSQLYCQDFKYAIIRDDNDYVTYEDVQSLKEVTPPMMVKKIESIISNFKSDLKVVHSYLYKINVDETIDIYSLFVNYNFKHDCYLMAFNKLNATITEVPIILNMKWGFNNESGFNNKLLKYPLIEVKKSESGYIVFLKERVHDGNIYNAVITKIYSLNKELAFDLKFCYEEISLTLNNQKIKRILDNNAILVFEEKDTSFEYLGRIEIDPKTKTIIKKECLSQEFCQILFTTSGKEDEYILKNGFTTEY